MKYIELIIIAFLLTTFSCVEEMPAEETIEEEKEVAVGVMQVAEQDVEFTKTYFGRLKYARHMTHFAEVSGQIADLQLKPGQRVQRGQTLLSFPPVNHDLQVGQIQLTLEELAKSYERQSVLHENGAVAQISVERLKTQLDIQKKELDRMQKLNQITAPYNGVVTEVFVTPGDEVNAGTAVFSIADPNEIQVEFFVPAKDLRYVSVGDQILFVHDQGRCFGKITQKALQMDDSRYAYRVLATLEHKGFMNIGEIVKAIVPHEVLQNAYLIPDKAIKRQGNKEYIYLAKNGLAERTEIRSGKRIEVETLIKEGLQSGDLLVVAGVEKLADGTPIHIIE